MSEVIKLAVLGAGSVRCMPPIISALATYAGERPLEIRLYDADEERLDLMDRLARHCFHFTSSTHDLRFRPDHEEALQYADRIILMVGKNCARKLMGVKSNDFSTSCDQLISNAVEKLLAAAPPEADMLSLLRRSATVPANFYRKLDWPGEPSDEELRWLPHQILRWIRAEEQIYEFLQSQENSPFKDWLNDPNAAELVVNASIK